jgi:hypothetical protein
VPNAREPYGWRGWHPLGGLVTSTPALVGALPHATAVAANADGRLDAFVTGTDRALWHRYQLTPNTTFNWSFLPGGGWSPLDGTLTSTIAVARNHSGRLEVFARGLDNAVWHRSQVSAGSSNWGSWSSLNGVFTIDPAVAANADGRLEGLRPWRRQRNLAPGADQS